MENEKRFTLRMDGDLYNRISEVAKMHGRSTAKEVERAIAYYLNETFEKDSVFGKRLKGLREHKEKSRAELGQELGIPESDISKYERGILEPDHDTLIKIATYFLVSLDYLLGRSDWNGVVFPDAEKIIDIFPELGEGLSRGEELSLDEKQKLLTYAVEHRDQLIKKMYPQLNDGDKK